MWRVLILLALIGHGYWAYTTVGYDDFIIFRIAYALTVLWQGVVWLAKRRGVYRPTGKGIRYE